MRRARIHFNFRGQAYLGERLFQDVLLVGRPHIVIGRNRDEELRLRLRCPQMGTVRLVCDKPAAME